MASAAPVRPPSPAGTSSVLRSVSAGVLKPSDPDHPPVRKSLTSTGSSPSAEVVPTRLRGDEAVAAVLNRQWKRSDKPMRRASLPDLEVDTDKTFMARLKEAQRKREEEGHHNEEKKDEKADEKKVVKLMGKSDSDGKVVHRQRTNSFGRNWTIDLGGQEEDILSPTWSVPKMRRGSCKLTNDDVAKSGQGGGNAAMASAAPAQDDQAEEKDNFTDLSLRMRTVVGQLNMRMNEFMSKVKAKYKENSEFFNHPANMERLIDICHLIAVTNYRLAKWIHQLDNRAIAKPSRPNKSADAQVLDLFAESKFGLSRMETLSSMLSPMLQKIVSDAKNARRTVDGKPVDPALLEPKLLAMKRGIQDINELDGMFIHLEQLLQTTESLVHNPAAIKQVTTTFKAIQAIGRFKLGAKRGKSKQEQQKASEATEKKESKETPEETGSAGKEQAKPASSE
eukprot:TRINITY_DN8831_c0_g1_i1.p1 TRINITY_DN8831_c0_g1~~TRINITY_DN8831_c0_g1_i1.p1  ORF type:complete len:489 (-),score=114.27 TRINITY_DN8831_c0_g1_i1:62-1414(-)